MASNRTTETLREMLFETAESLRAGKISVQDAKAMVSVAGAIVKTAELEIQYAEVLHKMDASENGVNPGPMLLTQDAGKKD